VDDLRFRFINDKLSADHIITKRRGARPSTCPWLSTRQPCREYARP
jgi:hypothetical protein